LTGLKHPRWLAGVIWGVCPHPLKGSYLTCLIFSMIDHKSHFIQTYHKSNIVHHNSKITNHKSNIIHHRSQIIDHRSQIKIHKSKFTNQTSHIKNHKSQIHPTAALQLFSKYFQLTHQRLCLPFPFRESI